VAKKARDREPVFEILVGISGHHSELSLRQKTNNFTSKWLILLV